MLPEYHGAPHLSLLGLMRVAVPLQMCLVPPPAPRRCWCAAAHWKRARRAFKATSRKAQNNGAKSGWRIGFAWPVRQVVLTQPCNQLWLEGTSPANWALLNRPPTSIACRMIPSPSLGQCWSVARMLARVSFSGIPQFLNAWQRLKLVLVLFSMLGWHVHRLRHLPAFKAWRVSSRHVYRCSAEVWSFHVELCVASRSWD